MEEILVTMDSEIDQQSAPVETVEAEAPAERPQTQPQRSERGGRANGNGTGASMGTGSAASSISMKALLEAGVHFGHQTKR